MTTLKALIKTGTSPIEYCSFGWVETGGLGEVPVGYEEKDMAQYNNEIPAEWVFKRPETTAQKMAGEFSKLDVAHRAAFYSTRAAINSALEAGDTEAARLILSNTVVPAELEPVKQKLLEVLDAS